MVRIWQRFVDSGGGGVCGAYIDVANIGKQKYPHQRGYTVMANNGRENDSTGLGIDCGCSHSTIYLHLLLRMS